MDAGLTPASNDNMIAKMIKKLPNVSQTPPIILHSSIRLSLNILPNLGFLRLFLNIKAIL